MNRWSNYFNPLSKKKTIILTITLFCVVMIQSIRADELLDSYTRGGGWYAIRDNHPSDTPRWSSAVGQSFQTGDSNKKITVASFKLKKSGSPNGNAFAVLYEHSGDYGISSVPTGPALATSDAFDVTTISTTFAWYNLTFSEEEQYEMNLDTYYCIVFEGPISGTIDNNNRIYVQSAGLDSHSGNILHYETKWTASSSDTNFCVYGKSSTENQTSFNNPPMINNVIGNMTVDPNTECNWKVNVTDQDQLSDLTNVTIRVANSPSVEIDNDFPDFIESQEYWFRFTNETWEWYDGSGWNNTDGVYLNIPECTYPAKTDTNGIYSFRAKLSKIATKSSSWEFSAIAFDSEASAKDKQVGITVNLFLELTTNMTGHQWYVHASDTDKESVIIVIVSSNVHFTLQAKGSGDLANVTNTIGLGNITMHKDTLASSIVLTTHYQNIPGLVNVESIKDSQQVFMLWLDVPVGTALGTYNYNLKVRLVEYSA